MRFKLSNLIILISFLLSFALFAKQPTLTNGTYAIDNAHTRVSFTIPHFVISKVEGRFNEVQSNLFITSKPEEMRVEVVIPVASIDTAIKQRDEHLKSADFFDAEKFPEIRFVSKKVTGTLAKFKMVGDLRIKDVKKEITLTGGYTGSVVDTWGNTRVALTATGKINRKDFNIKYNDSIDLGPVVGDEVTINIITEGILKK